MTPEEQRRVEEIRRGLKRSVLPPYKPLLDDDSGVICDLLDIVDRLAAEKARLRKAIEDAPHWLHCTLDPCNCWKKAALEEK